MARTPYNAEEILQAIREDEGVTINALMALCQKHETQPVLHEDDARWLVRFAEQVMWRRRDRELGQPHSHLLSVRQLQVTRDKLARYADDLEQIVRDRLQAEALARSAPPTPDRPLDWTRYLEV